jgi:hypothetical protein
METLDRRTLLRRGLLAGGGIAALGPLHALGADVAYGQRPRRAPGYGPLVNKGDLWLPDDFDYLVVQRQGELMDDGNIVPGIFDGMAAYRGRKGTTVLIRNHENRRQAGEIPVVVPDQFLYDLDSTYNAGNTKVVLDTHSRGRNLIEVLKTFAVLGGTDTNCAGDREEPDDDRERAAEARPKARVGPGEQDEGARPARPPTRWSLAEVPGCGCRKLSSTTWSAMTPSASRARPASVRRAPTARAVAVFPDSDMGCVTLVMTTLASWGWERPGSPSAAAGRRRSSPRLRAEGSRRRSRVRARPRRRSRPWHRR